MQRASLLLTAAGVAFACLGLFFPRGGEPSPACAQVARGNILTNSLAMKLAFVPAGRFLMGSPATEMERGDDEQQHEVTIGKAFFLGIHEVTQALYEKVMGKNPSFFTSTAGGKARVLGQGTGDHPVEDLSWHDATAFCRKLAALPDEKAKNRVYRLPTEAEWEYACRAGTKTATHCGATLDSFQANFNGLSPYGGDGGPFLKNPCAVAQYPANDFGLFDMHGNVMEWCSDWYDADYYQTGSSQDPQGPKSGTQRVVRGGCWMNSGKACRSAQRNKLDPAQTNYGLGLRVVLEYRGPG